MLIKNKIFLNFIVLNASFFSITNLTKLNQENNISNKQLLDSVPLSELSDSVVVNWISLKLKNYNSLPLKYYDLEKTWASNIMENDMFAPGKIISIEKLENAEKVFLPLGYWNKFETMWKLIGKLKHWDRTNGTKIEFKILNRFWGPKNENVKTAIIEMDVEVTKNSVTKKFNAVSNNFYAKGIKKLLNPKDFLTFIKPLKESSLQVNVNETANEVFEKLKKAKSNEEKIKILKKIGWTKVISETKPLKWKVNYIPKKINEKTNQIEIEVEIFHVLNKQTIKNKFLIKGFKSQDVKNNEEINKVKKTIDNKYKNVTLNSTSPWTKKLPSMARTAFSNNLSDNQLKELNIPLLTKEEKQSTIVNYKISNVNDYLGEATIEVVITKDKLVSSTSFIVKGFETSNNYHQKIVEDGYKKILENNKISEKNNVINLVKNSSYSSRLPSRIEIKLGENLSVDQLRNFNINLTDNLEAEITANFREIDDKNGTATIVILISSEEINKQLTIIVNGFRTKNEQDKKDVSDLKSFLEDKYKNVKIPKKSNDKNSLPSEIKAELQSEILTEENIKRLGIETLNPKTLPETIFNYKIIKANDGNGQLTIEVEIIQGEASDNFTFEIKGFQTQNQRNQMEVDEVLTKFKKDNPNPTIDETSDLATKTVLDANYEVGDILSGNLLNDLNLVIDDEDFELEWEFKVKSIDNENGILTIEVTISKNFSEAKGEITITGFLKKI